jgi:hypothetical protein
MSRPKVRDISCCTSPTFRDGTLAARPRNRRDRRSAIARYYYSPFDHAINPAWTQERQGARVRVQSRDRPRHRRHRPARRRRRGERRVLQHEETSWHARPDVSPDGTRIVYSSYLGRQWQQLWLLPIDGGYPFPLTYGDYDNTNPRGRRMAARSRSSPIDPATPRSG